MSSWSSFQTPNIGLLFYRHIYTEKPIRSKLAFNSEKELVFDIPKEGDSPFEDFYSDLYKKGIKKYKSTQVPDATGFTLFTTYPGLICGSGYGHDTKARGDFKIGFFFDHTTGLPVIPGSSVKGAIRSAFEKDLKKNGKCFAGEKSVGFVKWFLTEIGAIEVADQLDENKLKNFISFVFGDEDYPGKDVFFDANIDIKSSKEGNFLASDFITPHKEPLKNPNPIQFLKVLPDVAFSFSFKFRKDELLSLDQKEKLFKFILLTLGVGAKTNVGYGQFTEVKKVVAGVHQAAFEAIRDTNLVTNINRSAVNDIIKKKKFDGKCTKADDKFFLFEFTVNKFSCCVVKKKDKCLGINLGDPVQIEFSNFNINSDIANPPFKVKKA